MGGGSVSAMIQYRDPGDENDSWVFQPELLEEAIRRAAEFSVRIPALPCSVCGVRYYWFGDGGLALVSDPDDQEFRVCNRCLLLEPDAIPAEHRSRAAWDVEEKAWRKRR